MDSMEHENLPAKNERPKGIAVCLSGGGYRAALLHLGTLGAMHEAGILEHVETVSSVSGGSIISAFLAVRKLALNPKGLLFADWEREIAAPFREKMKTDIRTGPIFLHLLWNWLAPNVRASHIRRNYRRLVASDATGKAIRLDRLPESPDFIYCATDLPNGVNFEFSRTEIGSYASGKASPGDIELSYAVAASACFPPVFGPIKLNFAKYVNKGMKRMYLSDGGVYDNLGIEPVLKDHSTIIVSDGGSPFSRRSSANPIFRATRFFSVIMDQVGRLRKRQFFADDSSGRFQGAYIPINNASSPYGYPLDLVNGSIASIRTDLDRFSAAEARILENHGYLVAAHVLKSHHNRLIKAGVELNDIPHPGWMDKEVVAKALRSSARRFSLKRLFRMT